jgi:hypothetical protein
LACKKTRNLQRAHFSLTHATPLVEGESTGGAASHFTRSSLEAQNGLPLFWWPFRDSGFVAMVEPPVSYLRVHGPYRYLRDGYRIYVCRLHVFYLPCPTSSTRRHGQKEDYWSRAGRSCQSEWLPEGAHRDKDSLRDRNKHVDKVKRDQDAALDRYVL